MMARRFFSCNCYDCSHNICVDIDTEDDVDFVYISPHLTTYRNFFQRFVIALKYLFKNESTGCYAEIILSKEQVEDLITFITPKK